MLKIQYITLEEKGEKSRKEKKLTIAFSFNFLKSILDIFKRDQ